MGISPTHILHPLLEFLFPRSKEVKKLESMTAEQYLSQFQRSLTPVSSITSIFNYSDPYVRLAIHEVKYRKNRIIASRFGEILYGEIKRVVHSQNKILVVPVPSSKSRQRKKGFSHTELLVEEILKNDRENLFEYGKSVLVKTKETIPQTETKSKGERKKNPIGSFGIRDGSRISGREVIVVDDVLTTGSTLKEAMATLKRAGAKRAFGITAAH
ncbi:MAG: phosphoribosyltransferase family protein [Patescibacteria group bacterium]